MGLKILHSADWHLDSPFAGFDDSQRALLKQEQQSIPGKTAQLCRREKCDLMLLAGDIFDGEPTRETVEALKKALSECGARVFITPGNHDFCAPGSLWLEESWPENVYVFTGGLEAVTIPDLNCRVYGAGYQSMDSAPLLENFRAEGSEKYCIAVLHGDPTRKDSPYCPITAQQVRDSGLQYLALGHIHKPQAVRRNRIVYAGALEPVDRNDTGPHGYVKGELTGKGNHISWIPCASREYIHLEVLVDERDTAGSVKQNIRKLIHEYGNENIYKITLAGKRDPDIAFEVNHLAEEGCVLEILDETIPAYDFEKLYAENKETLLGRYIEKFAGCEEGSVEYCALCEGVEALLTGNRG